jgi:hypothetical protein
LQKHGKTNGKSVHLFAPESVRFSRNWGNSWSQWGKAYEPSSAMMYFSSAPQSVQLQVTAENGSLVYEDKLDTDKGYNVFNYTLSFSESGYKNWLKIKGDEVDQAKNGLRYLPKGDYTVKLIQGKARSTAELKIK